MAVHRNYANIPSCVDEHEDVNQSLANKYASLKKMFDELSEKCCTLEVENNMLRHEAKHYSTDLAELLKKTSSKCQELHETIISDSATKIARGLRQMTLGNNLGGAIGSGQHEDVANILMQTNEQLLRTEREKEKYRKQCQELEAQLNDLKQQVDNHGIDALKQNIEIWADDFRSERQDRENAQARIIELEQELCLKNIELQQFQHYDMERLKAQRQNAFNNYGTHYSEHYAVDGTDDDDDVENGYDVVDSVKLSPSLKEKGSTGTTISEP